MPEDKINVLFIIVQIDIMGGSERLVYDLAYNMDRKIFNPSIAWFYGKNKLQDFENLGIHLFHIPKIRRFDFSTMRNLADIIENNNIHVVNAHHFISLVYSYYGCKMKNYIKLIYTEHSEWEIEKISWKWKKIGNYLLKHVDGTVGVSSKVSKLMQERFKIYRNRPVTIQNGVDLQTFSNNIDNKANIRRELGIDDNEKIIGIVANFRKIKNHLFLLRAFDKLVKVYENVRLLLVGEGSKGEIDNTEGEIREFVCQSGLDQKVLFLGYRADVSALLGIMDVFCLTSFKEGLPISLIEAMASGLPVVGTAVDGIRDVVIHEKNGFLVRLGDVEGLKKALYRLLYDDSLRERCGYESRSIAVNTFSLRQCTSEYQDLFLSVLGKK